MRNKSIKEAALVLTGLITLTALITFSGADLALSSIFYIDGAWPVGELFLWKLLYRIDRLPSVILATAGIAAAALSFWKPEMKQWRRSALFLVFFLVLGPGLLVNTVFKEGWGRPRPRDIVEFGGKKPFLHPWEKGIRGEGRSFPSGHASAAFFLIAPYFIYRRLRPSLANGWLAGGVFFGTIMSIARITQGAHFLSDTLWAFGMVYLMGLLLSHLMGLDLESPPAHLT